MQKTKTDDKDFISDGKVTKKCETKKKPAYLLECTLNSKSCRIKMPIGSKLDLDEIINPWKL